MKMSNQLFTEKFQPYSIKEFVGFSHQSVLQYVENVLKGTEKKKAMIFHGLPGNGKTTLAFLLANHFGISHSYSNASDSRKKSDINADVFRTESLKNKKTLIIFDECDGLSKSAFTELEKTLKKYSQPVILIANDLDKIPYTIRKICHIEKFSVDHFSLLALANKVAKLENLDLSREEIKDIVSHSKSYRNVLHALQFGMGTNPPKQLSPDEQVLANLSGQSVDLSTTDLSGLIIRFNDNSNSPNLISLADLWNHRYVSGYTFGKYIVRAILSSIRTPGIKKLEYPRTYSMIHTAKTGKKRIEHSGENKSTKPRIKIIGFK
jgi:hypothetical protein